MNFKFFIQSGVQYHKQYGFIVCFDALPPSQQFFSHVRTISCLPGFNTVCGSKTLWILISWLQKPADLDSHCLCKWPSILKNFSSQCAYLVKYSIKVYTYTKADLCNYTPILNVLQVH